MPVKPLSFKGDKKPPKKRKHRDTSPSATGATSASTTAGSAAEDDSWTTPDAASQVTGPTLLVLPTQPPTCLASDAHGNVFASRLENLVDGVPETAEPHDVRQVWVANSVPGAAGLSFRAPHGGYLGCDAVGRLSARREARGAEEAFELERVDLGSGGKQRWRARTAASVRSEGDAGRRYLCAVRRATKKKTKKSHDDDDDDGDDGEEDEETTGSVDVRGDGTTDQDAAVALVLKMQTRFLPQTQQQRQEARARESVSRAELERAVGRRLEDDEVRRLKRAKRHGTYHEDVLDMRAKSKHDKFA